MEFSWWQILLVVSGLVLLFAAASYYQFIEFNFGKILSFRRKIKPKPTRVSFGDEIGFVFAGDGTLYKIHLGLIIESGERIVLDNIKANLDNKLKFNFRTFFTYNILLGGRTPNLLEELPLVINPPDSKKGVQLNSDCCKKFSLTFKKHFFIVDLFFSHKKISKKIFFPFNEYYQKGFESDRQEAIRNKQPKVSNLPIVK